MNYYKEPYSKNGFLNWAEIKKYTDDLIEQFDVKTPSADTLIKKLSGGNQQKLVLGREIMQNPDLLIAMHPTRGLDVGATRCIHERLLECRNNNHAVLLVSTELDELIALSDRLVIMCGGRVMGIVFPDTPIVDIGLMMAGCRIEELNHKDAFQGGDINQ